MIHHIFISISGSKTRVSAVITTVNDVLVIVVILIVILFHGNVVSRISRHVIYVFIRLTVSLFSIYTALANPFFFSIAHDTLAKVPNVKIGRVVTIRGRNTPTSVEDDLPDAGDTRQQVTHIGSVANVPHLESPVGSTENLELVVLEAGNCTCVSSQSVQEIACGRIPHSKRRIGSS